jgi:hypothetical protein
MSSRFSPDAAYDNEREERPFSVLIALNRNSQPSAQDVALKVRELFPKLKGAQDVVEDETGFGFSLCGSVIAIVRMSGPIPIDAADEPTVRKPLSAALLESQQAYLLIAVRDADQLQAAIAATEVAAAVVECCPHAMAVYWPSARLWIAPNVFVDEAMKHVHSRPPITLWIDVRVWQVEGKQHRAGFTRGLKALGHKEFEVRSSPESVKDLRERLEGLCWYVLTNGAIVRDGHTVGHDADEHIAILLVRSAHGTQDLVLRLDYDEAFKPRRPWWKLI